MCDISIAADIWDMMAFLFDHSPGVIGDP
jgi:hypothetical protein